MNQDTTLLLPVIAQALFDKQGMNILVLDVRGVSSLTDYVVIAEGYVDKHVVALAHYVETVLKDLGRIPARVEGYKAGDWVVLDYVDVMVHIFMPGLRDQYHLEGLWEKALIVDVPIRVSADTLHTD